MKKYLLIFLTLIWILAACGPSEEAIAQAIAETETAKPTETEIPPTETPAPTATPEPTPTATPIPLSDIDLSQFVGEPGDLPAGYTLGQSRDIAPEMFDSNPEAENVYYQQFSHDDDVAGGLTIFLYADQETADKAFRSIKSAMGDDCNTQGEAGEESNYCSFDYSKIITGGLKMVEHVSQTCTIVVHIRMTDTTNTDNAEALASKLHERISPLVCPME